MSTKIKVFAFTPENEEKISKLIAEVNVMENGFLIENGNLGVLYREKGEVGSSQEGLVNAISAELAKSQKQYVLQEGLIRAYTGMIDFFITERKRALDLKESLVIKLEEYQKGYDSELYEKFMSKEKELATLEQKHKQSKKADKEAVLKEIYTANEEFKPIREAFDTYDKAFKDGKAELSHQLQETDILIVNLAGKIKENQGLLEQAKEDRDHAKVFIGTSKKLIADISSGSIEEAMNQV